MAATTTASNHDPAFPVTSSDAADIIVAGISAHKRKRPSDNEHDHANVSKPLPSLPLLHNQIQKDILDLLQRHDTDPSFLKHPIPDVLPHEQPSQKKPRLSGHGHSTPPGDATIAAKLSNTTYESLQQIKTDAALVAEELVSTIRSQARERDVGGGGRPFVEELKQIRRVQSLELLIKQFVDKESRSSVAARTHAPDGTAVKSEERSGAVNDRTEDTELVPAHAVSGTVLTLFGNAPTPKQLFSSMQHAPALNRHGPTTSSVLPVDEMSLPVGLTATKVIPAPDDHSQGPTFEDVFPPPYSLPALNPPKHHKKSSTRDTKLTWEFKDPVQRSRKGGYTVQPLSVGTWLGHGGLADDSESSSTREKRQQRTRALSGSGDTFERPDQAAWEEETLAREEEALFRRAYSSFAPTCDNAGAVISEDTKNMVWWQKVGNRRFNDAFAIDPALRDDSEQTQMPIPSALFEEPTTNDKEDDFSDIIEKLDELDGLEPDPKPVKSKTDVDQIMREISELLETLASHQRIRNATLPSSRDAVARTPLSPAPLVASRIGKPDEPSDEEYSIYRSLQRELSYLILKLPPYAVAKLDGDQLSELGVSKDIRLQTRHVKGTMEEDQVTRQAKFAAMSTAAPNMANLARPSSSAGQHYSTSANRTPAIGQAANTRYGQQYGSRTPAASSQYQRQSTHPSSYATTPVAGQRYGQPDQWPRPNTSQQGFGQSSNPQLFQRPAQTPASYGHYNAQYQTPQTQPRFNPQAAQQYQQQQQQQQRTTSHAAAANAVSYQTNNAAQQQKGYNHTTSPVKGFPAVSMAPTPSQPRPLYGGQPPHQLPAASSSRMTPTGYLSQSNTPINGFSARQPPGIAPRPTSTTPQPPPNHAPTPPSHMAPTQSTTASGAAAGSAHASTSTSTQQQQPATKANGTL